jgi:hypothetical protein
VVLRKSDSKNESENKIKNRSKNESKVELHIWQWGDTTGGVFGECHKGSTVGGKHTMMVSAPYEGKPICDANVYIVRKCNVERRHHGAWLFLNILG